MPYEGQPFQNFIPQQFKNINNNIKIYGYVSHNLIYSFENDLQKWLSRFFIFSK